MRAGNRLGNPDKDSLKVVLTGLDVRVWGYRIAESQTVRLSITTSERSVLIARVRYRWRPWPNVRLLTHQLRQLPTNAFTQA